MWSIFKTTVSLAVHAALFPRSLASCCHGGKYLKCNGREWGEEIISFGRWASFFIKSMHLAPSCCHYGLLTAPKTSLLEGVANKQQKQPHSETIFSLHIVAYREWLNDVEGKSTTPLGQSKSMVQFIIRTPSGIPHPYLAFPYVPYPASLTHFLLRTLLHYIIGTRSCPSFVSRELKWTKKLFLILL